MVRIKELHWQGTEQNHNAGSVQRASELPAKDAGVHGVRQAAKIGF